MLLHLNHPLNPYQKLLKEKFWLERGGGGGRKTHSRSFSSRFTLHSPAILWWVGWIFSGHFSRLSVNRTVNYFCADFGSRTSDWIEWKGFTFEWKGWKVFNTIRTECAFQWKPVFLQLCDSDITHLLFKFCWSRFRCRSEIGKCKNETFNGSS